MNNNLEKYLFTVLQYDSYGEKKLTAFDRMFIHKKISAFLNEKPYELPPKTEKKVKEIIYIIDRLAWESPQ